MTDFIFGVEDLKVATWTSTGTYDTLLDIVGVTQIEITEETTNAILEGDDQEIAVHTKAKSGRVRAQFAFRDLEVYEAIMGATLAAAAGSYQNQLTFKGARSYPYIGLCGKLDEVNATGCRHLFIPKCKVTQGFSVSSQYGQFATPQIELRAVEDGDYGIFQIYDYNTLKTIVMPPV